MEKTIRNVKYLSFQNIVDINREVLLKTGGFVKYAGMLQNQNSLNYIIGAVKGKIGNKELYPSLIQKAAVYAYNIITRHVFLDGNKRTGMICAFQFLRKNGCTISESIEEDDIVKFACSIAKNEINLNDVILWFEERLDYFNL